MSEEIKGQLTVLPEDCVKVNIDNGDWGAFFDTSIGRNMIISTNGGVPLSFQSDKPRTLVPMYKLDSESVSGLSHCLEVAAKDKCTNFSIVIHESEMRIGFIAHGAD